MYGLTTLTYVPMPGDGTVIAQSTSGNMAATVLVGVVGVLGTLTAAFIGPLLASKNEMTKWHRERLEVLLTESLDIVNHVIRYFPKAGQIASNQNIEHLKDKLHRLSLVGGSIMLLADLEVAKSTYNLRHVLALILVRVESQKPEAGITQSEVNQLAALISGLTAIYRNSLGVKIDRGSLRDSRRNFAKLSDTQVDNFKQDHPTENPEQHNDATIPEKK